MAALAENNDASRGEASGARNGTRTRDPDLGKVVLYQLSYSRVGAANIVPCAFLQAHPCISWGDFLQLHCKVPHIQAVSTFIPKIRAPFGPR